MNNEKAPRFTALHDAFLKKADFCLEDICEAHELCEELETQNTSLLAALKGLREDLASALLHIHNEAQFAEVSKFMELANKYAKAAYDKASAAIANAEPLLAQPGEGRQ